MRSPGRRRRPLAQATQAVRWPSLGLTEAQGEAGAGAKADILPRAFAEVRMRLSRSSPAGVSGGRGAGAHAERELISNMLKSRDI